MHAESRVRVEKAALYCLASSRLAAKISGETEAVDDGMPVTAVGIWLLGTPVAFSASPGTMVTTVGEASSAPTPPFPPSLAHFRTASARRSRAARGPASATAKRRAQSASESEVCIFTVVKDGIVV